ncbi:hypothetical protein AAVH_17548 [Aphelenchoides avenae]|nr:hypothetical protein AAVH_17548 [Aphelenchus avenae]
MAKRKTKWAPLKPHTRKAREHKAEVLPPPEPSENSEFKPCPCGYYCGYYFLRCDNCHRGCHFQCLGLKRNDANFLNVFVCQACKDDGIAEAEVEERSREENKPRAVVYEVYCNFHPEDKDGEVKCMPIGHLPRDCPLKNDDCCLCGMECKFEHVYCEHCKGYFHCMCEGLAEQDVEAIDDYFCKECRRKHPKLQITYKDAAGDLGVDAVGGDVGGIPGSSGTQTEPPAKRGRCDAANHSGHQPNRGMRREVKEEQPEEGVSNALLLPGLVSNAGTHASQATPSEQVALLAPSARWAADNGPPAKRVDAPLAVTHPAEETLVKLEDDQVVVIDDDDDEHDDNVIYGTNAASPRVSVATAARGRGTASAAVDSTLVRNAQPAGPSKQNRRHNHTTPPSEAEARVKADEPPEQAVAAVEQQPPPTQVPPAQSPQVKAENDAAAPVPPSSAEDGENVAQEPAPLNPNGGLYERQLEEKENELAALRQQIRQKDADLEAERATRTQVQEENARLKQEVEKHEKAIIKLTMERLGMGDSK